MPATDAEIAALSRSAMARAAAVWQAKVAGYLTEREHREDVARVVAVHATEVRALRAGAR